MCSAGITSYESPATNSGTFQDVYMNDKKRKSRKGKHKYYEIKQALKRK